MLNNLKPTEGSRKNKIRRCRGLGSGLGKNGGSGSKGQNSRSDLDLKVDNFLYIEDYQKEDLKTLVESNMPQLTYLI